VNEATSAALKAHELTTGDRNDQYGHPLDDYTKVGAMIAPLLASWVKDAFDRTRVPGVPETKLADLIEFLGPVPPELACLCMTQVKAAREVNAPKEDNRVDGAGYWNCVDMIHKERARREGRLTAPAPTLRVWEPGEIPLDRKIRFMAEEISDRLDPKKCVAGPDFIAYLATEYARAPEGRKKVPAWLANAGTLVFSRFRHLADLISEADRG